MLFEHVFFLKILKTGQNCLHDITRQNVAARFSILSYAFVAVNKVCGKMSLTFDFASRHHFVREIKLKKYNYFIDFPVFSVQF